MFFSDVPGNNPVKDVLIHQVNTSRISHAQVFFGAEGYGALQMAIAFAQYLFCENKTPTDSCGKCAGCVKMNKLAHPDFHLIFPINTNNVIKKDATCNDYMQEFREAVLNNPYLSLYDWLQYLGIENKQGIINTEEASEVLRKLSYKSYESEYKIVLLWMAENMNPHAANKLLKIIEEPPEKTIFLLVVESRDELLVTIQSRTQGVKIIKPTDEDVRVFLTTETDLPPATISQIVLLSDGNLNIALKLAEEGEVMNQDTQSFIEWMRICYKINMTKLLPWVESIAGNGRENQKNFLIHALQLIRQTYILNLKLSSMVKLNSNDTEALGKFSPFVNNGNIADLLQTFNDAYYALERNAAAKILFLNLSFKVSTLINRKPEIQKAA